LSGGYCRGTKVVDFHAGHLCCFMSGNDNSKSQTRSPHECVLQTLANLALANVAGLLVIERVGQEERIYQHLSNAWNSKTTVL